MHRAAVVLALLLLSPLSAPATASHAGSSTTLATIEAQTERIRNLKPTAGVHARFLANSAFNSVVRSEIQRDNPDSEIELTQRESVLLGLLNKTQSVRQIIYGGMVSQVIGLYDYHVKTLYVRGQTQKALGVDRYVIAHEFTHALQDQHWHLGRLLPDQTPLTYRNSDAVAAHHALTEGDAVNTQTLFISREYSPRQIQQLYAEAAGTSIQPMPRSFQREFDFPYTTGLTFVKTLYAQGGMRAVDAAYRRLPSSTYEIMHPGAYLRHWHPKQVTLHGIAGYSDWKQTDDDVFGALGYQVLIWQFASQKLANQATNNYRGDRYIFLENGDQDAIVMKSVWATSKAAAFARSAIGASLKARFQGSRWREHESILSYQNGTVYLVAKGKSVTLVFAPSAELARGMGTAQPT
jgi:hypothetical protein